MKFTFSSIAILFFLMLFSCDSPDLELENLKEENELLKQEIESVENARKDSLKMFLLRADIITSTSRKSKEDAIKQLNYAYLFAKGNEARTVLKERISLNSQLRDYHSIVLDYSKLISLNSGNDTCFYNRALVHEKLRDRQSAVNDLREAISLGHKEADELHERINPLKNRIVGYETRCCDGTTSNATGRGACSHHGGVCTWNAPIYRESRKY